MSLDILKEQLPEYARDLKLNLSGLGTITSLTPQQLWGTIMAAGMASGQPAVMVATAQAAREHLSPAAMLAAKAATAIMGMNNIYYRFTHLVGNETYAAMPARLRMNVMANPGVEKVDFELWSLAVSALEGCGRCIEAHEATLMQHNVSREAIQDAVRIAAILKGVAVTLAAEAVYADSGLESAAA
jgi:alkyl hydroperoxide reductase subunit D